MYRHILIPTDGSELAQKAVTWIIARKVCRCESYGADRRGLVQRLRCAFVESSSDVEGICRACRASESACHEGIERRRKRGESGWCIAIIVNPETSPLGGTFYLREFETAAGTFHVEPITRFVHSAAEIEAVVGRLGQAPNSGLIVAPETFTSANRELLPASKESGTR